jgi:hypothetical protein
MFYDLNSMTDEVLDFWNTRAWHQDRPQRSKAWIGLPRDARGLAPSQAFFEMHRLQLPDDLT